MEAQEEKSEHVEDDNMSAEEREHIGHHKLKRPMSDNELQVKPQAFHLNLSLYKIVIY